MKAKLYVCIILTALIAVFTISGCNKVPEAETAATLDEATVDEVVISSTATTITTTVATTETTVGETTIATEATTKAEEVTEAVKVNNQTSNKANTSNADKTENKTSVTTQKPNNTSNSNTSGNTTSNTTTNKPSSNTNGNTNTSSNTSSNTNKPKPKPVETQPHATEAPVVITDDTPLTFEQMNTPENMQKIVDYCNAYFETLGMTYDESLDPSWAGWYYGRQGGLCVFDTCSLNEEKRLVAGTIKQQVDAILIDYYGHEYSDFYFKTVYVVNELDGYYDIVFCYG